MIYVWLTLLIIVNTLWLGLVFFALPGNWLMIITVILFALWQKGSFSIYIIIAAIVLALVGEMLEFAAGAGGAKAAGGGKKAMAAAIIGTIMRCRYRHSGYSYSDFWNLDWFCFWGGYRGFNCRKKSRKRIKRITQDCGRSRIGTVCRVGCKIYCGNYYLADFYDSCLYIK